MPRYDYVCQSCGRSVEVIHGVHSPGPSQCQHCGGEMRKLLSAPAIVFKGSGWAKKDRSAKPSTAKAKSDTDVAPKTTPSSDGQPAKPTTDARTSGSDA
jgi:putative FmdB family regulatory protein